MPQVEHISDAGKTVQNIIDITGNHGGIGFIHHTDIKILCIGDDLLKPLFLIRRKNTISEMKYELACSQHGACIDFGSQYGKVGFCKVPVGLEYAFSARVDTQIIPFGIAFHFLEKVEIEIEFRILTVDFYGVKSERLEVLVPLGFTDNMGGDSDFG